MKTTMKKVLSMALALVLVLGMLPMAALATREVATGAPACFTANEGATHTHDSSKCENPEAHKDIGVSCIDANSSGYCDSCYGAVSAPHTCVFDSAWQTNGTQHWKVCGCGATQTPQNHTDPDGLSGDTNEHWNYCSICNTKYNVAAHTGGTASCTSGKLCSVCNTAYTGADSTNGHIASSNTYEHDETQHWQICNQGGTAHNFGYSAHTWEAATATTPEICTICRRTGRGALGSSTFNVYVVNGGVTQNGGSFTMTAGSSKTANEILNAFLATSTYSASNISSYYVTANGSQLTGNQALTLTAASTYTLTITPANNVNNNYTNNNDNVISVGFVPNYNNYNTPYVINGIAPGTPVYSINNNITRVGYTLEAWCYNRECTEIVPNNAVVNNDATFYAKWKQIAPYNVSVVVYTNGNKQTPTVTLDLYEWAQDGVITLADLQQAVVKHGIKANNNAGLSVYGPFTPNQWTSYVSHDYFRNSTERVSVNAGEATVLYAMVHNVKITKGTVDPYGAIADKSNPKTGDMIYAPMMVLGLSASALAVLFYLNKKRAF